MLIKPISDNNQYDSIILDNGIKVVVVNSKNALHSSVSINIGAGQLQDPEDCQGLAHFLEHTVFMGSKKYPRENAFAEFIEKNNGVRNAFTSVENTNFFFTINTDAFDKTLDMLSQFFKEPLISVNSLEKEINAVNSEHIQNLTNDDRRYYQVLKEIANDDSEIRKYGCGTIESLSKKFINKDGKVDYELMREELLNFHKKYYVSENIVVVTMSNLPLNEQISTIKKYFEDIEKKNKSNIKKYNDPFTINSNNEVFLKYVNIKSLRNMDKLSFKWIIPSDIINYKNNMLSFISDILGDETENSITSKLYNKGFIISLDCGLCYKDKSINILDLNVTLTDLGIDNDIIIIKAVFDYINKIRNITKEKFKKMYEEYANIVSINYDYQYTSDDTDKVIDISSAVTEHSLEDCLDGYLKNMNYNDDCYVEFNNIMNNLHVNRCILTSISNNNDDIVDKKEKWTDTEYNVICDAKYSDFVNENIQNQNFDFKLPEKNPYIPINLDIIDYRQDNYNEVYNNVYIRALGQLNKPKTIIDTIFFTDIKDPYSETLLNIYLDCKEKEIMKKFYNAIKAGYDINILSHGSYMGYKTNFFIIRVSGYTDKINQLHKDVIEYIFYKNDIKNSLFENVKNGYIKNIGNIKLQRPQSWSLNIFKNITVPGYYLPDKYISIANKLTYKECIDGFNKLMNNFVSKMIYMGNIKGDDIPKFLSHIDKIPENKDSINPIEKEYIVDSPNKHSTEIAVTYYFDFGSIDKDIEYYEKYSKLKLFSSCLADSFFDKIRTENQIGYNVSNNILPYGTVYNKRVCYIFSTQSGVKTSDEIRKVFDDYLKDIVNIIKTNYDCFDKIKKSIISELKKPKRNLFEYCVEDEIKILNIRPDDYINGLISSIDKTDIKDIIEFAEKLPEPTKIIVKKN